MVATPETPEIDAVLAKLPPQHRKLVVEYLKSWDGHKYHITNAAIAAGYSKKTAYSAGSRALKRVEIQDAINTILRKRMDPDICSINEVDGILSEMIRAKPSDYVELLPDGEEVCSYTRDSKNQNAVKTVLRRMHSTGSGDGKHDVVVAGVELHDKPRCIDIFYKRFNAYPRDRAEKDFLEALRGANGIRFEFDLSAMRKGSKK